MKPETKPPGEVLLDELELSLAGRLGELIRFWGFGPHAGRVWTLLYLSAQPLSAPQIAARLRMSAGSVSQTLGVLSRWGIVRRTRAPGRRLILLTGTADVWSAVTRVLGERELGMVRSTTALLDDILAALPRARQTGADRARVEHVERRLRSLQRLSRAAEAMLEAVLAAATFDLGRLRSVVRLARGMRAR